jgi:hypothetical protein
VNSNKAQWVAFGCVISVLFVIADGTAASPLCLTEQGSCSASGAPGGPCACQFSHGSARGHIIPDYGHDTLSQPLQLSPEHFPEKAVPRASLGQPSLRPAQPSTAPQPPSLQPAETEVRDPTIRTTRNFFAPHDIPPLTFAAYGIVAFPQKSNSETLRRYISICEAYVATLPAVSESTAPLDKQMVTVWPLDNASLAARLNEQGEAVCKEAVEHYDLPTALIALREARTQEQKEFSGRGPYLLAWAPSWSKGKRGAIVLIADLSSATTPQQYLSHFQKWRQDIEQNPEVWQRGSFSEANLVTVIRNWADKWGTVILSIGRAENTE